MANPTPKEQIGIDLKGRVKRLQLAERNMLLPVFEAIVNSIHAIEDTKVPNGQIEIIIQRTPQSSFNYDEEKKRSAEIIGFTVEDNGIGFTEDNYKSFKREYSTYKASRGGLGVGRFMWLKAFSDVKVESFFYEDQIPTKRSFFFNLKTEDGIDKHICSPLEKIENRKTIVKLIGYKDPYKTKCPKRIKTIADRIIEHCLIYFLNKDCPKIILKDEESFTDLNKYFLELTTGNTFKDKFSVGKFPFNITLINGLNTSCLLRIKYQCALITERLISLMSVRSFLILIQKLKIFNQAVNI